MSCSADYPPYGKEQNSIMVQGCSAFVMPGFLTSTKGTVQVSGFNIKTDLDKVRKNLGMCPQENILFEELTVEQHLKFFGQVSGMLRWSGSYNMYWKTKAQLRFIPPEL